MLSISNSCLFVLFQHCIFPVGNRRSCFHWRRRSYFSGIDWFIRIHWKECNHCKCFSQNESILVHNSTIEIFIFLFCLFGQGRRCTIRDCCIIEDGAVVPPETTVASFMKFTAKGMIQGDQGNPNFVPPAMQDLMVDFTKSYYENFRSALPVKPA